MFNPLSNVRLLSPPRFNAVCKQIDRTENRVRFSGNADTPESGLTPTGDRFVASNSVSSVSTPATPVREAVPSISLQLPQELLKSCYTRAMEDIRQAKGKAAKSEKSSQWLTSFCDLTRRSISGQGLSLLFMADLIHELTNPAQACMKTLAQDEIRATLIRVKKLTTPEAVLAALGPELTPEDYETQTCQTFQRMLTAVERFQRLIDIGLAKEAPVSGGQLFDLSMEAAAPEAKGITVQVQNRELLDELSNRLPQLTHQPHRIYGIFSNILMNAVKYTPEGGNIQVSFERINDGGGEQLCFSVTDNGIGILPEDQQQVLEGKRGKNALEQNIPGTGYGLRRVKKSVSALNITSPAYPDTPLRPGTRIDCHLPLIDPDKSPTEIDPYASKS